MRRPSVVRRVRLRPLVIAMGLASTALLGLGTTGTLSAFTATITNSTNSTTTGSLVMQETDDSSTPTATCVSTQGANNSYASCSAPNTYGGSASPLTPGGAGHTTVIRISNTGTTAANAFSLTPAACSQSGSGSATDLCSKLSLTLTCAPSTTGTAVSVYTGTLTAFSTGGAIDLKGLGTGSPCLPPAGAASYVSFKFVVTLASGADNTYQGLTASQPLTWQFAGA